MVLVTMRPRPSPKFDKPAVRIVFQVTQIVRFLLEGLPPHPVCRVISHPRTPILGDPKHTQGPSL